MFHIGDPRMEVDAPEEIGSPQDSTLPRCHKEVRRSAHPQGRALTGGVSVWTGGNGSECLCGLEPAASWKQGSETPHPGMPGQIPDAMGWVLH